MEEVKQVGIWIRVSTEDQAKGESPEHHEKRARLYAESKNWQVKEVYHLEAVSGKSVMNHPEARRMLDHIRKGRISGLIFSKLARLARNTKELLEFADLFRDSNADLISLQESIDTSTPAGRLFYTMIAAMAQWEREEIASRIAASVPIRAKLGKPINGKAIYGYKWENKVLVPDLNEAPVRKLIYELFWEHRKKKQVVRLLSEAGYRTRSGALFSADSVERLIRDETAKGLHRSNYTKVVGKQCVMKPREEWIFTPVEPIISDELWARCNLVLDEHEKRIRRPTKPAVYLFSGLAFCVCGEKMYVPSNSPKYTCRKCRNKIGVSDLEEVFHEQLKAFFLSPSDIGKYLSQAEGVIREREKLLETLLDEEKKIQQNMDRVYKLYLDEEISSRSFGERHKPLEERLEQIGEHIPELQAEIDFLKIQYLSSDEVLNEVRDLYSRWPELEYKEKRRIVESITERIVIDRFEVNIDLCYLPSHSEMMANRGCSQ